MKVGSFRGAARLFWEKQRNPSDPSADFIRRSETDYRGKKEEEEEEEGKKEIAAISPWGIHLDARKKKEKGEKSETTGYRLPRDFN